jgi:hypothetical protein
VWLLAAWALYSLSVWCSTGTLAPYAATHPTPIVDECGYIYNTDKGVFEATFDFVDGQDPERWRSSVVLRRILYPLLAYPLMKLLGFDLGGIATNVLLHWAAFALLAGFLLRTWGERAAVVGACLFATYPGVNYWVGQPFSYASIVPFSIAGTILVYRISESESRRSILLSCLALGVCFLAYDLFPYFGVGSLAVLAWRRRFPEVILGLLLMALPLALFLTYLSLAHGRGPVDGNSAAYSVILASYWNVQDFGAWWEVVRKAPVYLVTNYFRSNFGILPWTFLLAYGLGRLRFGRKLAPAEAAVLGGALLVFLVNNLAPPYEGWQMRGDFIPRIYQPIFVVLLIYIARQASLLASLGRLWRVGYAILVAACVLCNAVIVFGALTGSKRTDRVYQQFYQHFGRGWMVHNTSQDRFGVRPLGFCDRERGARFAGPRPY